MANAIILFVDNDTDFRVTRTEFLEQVGYRVISANDPVEAHRIIKGLEIDLMILDVRLHDDDDDKDTSGLALAEETDRSIPKIILTGFPSTNIVRDALKPTLDGSHLSIDVVAKSQGPGALLAVIEDALSRFLKRPFETSEKEKTSIVVSCTQNQPVSIRVTGPSSYSAIGKKFLDIDVGAFTRLGDNTLLLDWRFNSKHLGKQLHQLIFVNHPELFSSFNQLLGESTSNENIHIRFETHRELLQVPFEFLFDSVNDDGDYMVLRHPFGRTLTGIRTKRENLSPTFFNKLHRSNDDLRILLIASNTNPPIPGVDEEIKALDSYLRELFQKKGLSTVIDTLPTEQATKENVKKVLNKCPYHIMHYAGHGVYDNKSPEKSHLLFWQKPGRQGVVESMSISEMQMLLRGSELRFVYLSCCVGVKTGNAELLLDDDFLGIADGIIQSGIPSVLGFRWPVSDIGAKSLAIAFYDSLVMQGQIDTAVLDARCEIAARNRDDITWLSPILITQL